MGETFLGDPSVSVKRASEKGITHSSPLKISATLVDKKTGKKTTQEVFLGDIPQMTPRGTFIINGIERTVINQLVRSPGAYFSAELDRSSGRLLHKAEMRPLHGSWLEFEVGKNDVIAARIDRRRKVVATAFLRALGIESDNEILAIFKEADIDENHKYITATLEKDPTTNKEEALIEIYKKMRPGEPAIYENAKNLFENLFFEPRRYELGRVGRFKINKRLNLTLPNEKATWVLTRQDIIGSLSYRIT